MTETEQLKLRVSELSSEDLFKMVNEEIVNYGKEEINLAYEELERRGLVSPDEPQAVVSTVAGLIGLAVAIVQSLIIHSGKEVLTYPRAIALAVFVSLIADYWHKPRPNTAFWRWVLWATSMVLISSLALWDVPNLLRQHIPTSLAFGIPTLIHCIVFYWVSKPGRPPRKAGITTWFMGSIIFTILYSWLMSYVA